LWCCVVCNILLEPEAVGHVHRLYEEWKLHLGKRGVSKSHEVVSCRALLTEAAVYLCRVAKRYCDTKVSELSICECSRMAATSSFVFLKKYDGTLNTFGVQWEDIKSLNDEQKRVLKSAVEGAELE
jgi:hypothetical protein